MATDNHPVTLPSGALDIAPRLAKVLGLLVFTELVYGVLRGFYGPLVSEISLHLGISDGQFNWFETAQQGVGVLMVIVFARLGDFKGLKRTLQWTTVLTATGAWVVAFAPGFTTFLLGYVLLSACAVWLPLEIAIVFKRTAGSVHQHRVSRRAAGVLISTFYLSIIVGAVFGGALSEAAPLPVILSVPAILATLCIVVVHLGIEDDEPTSAGTGLDWAGVAVLVAMLGSVLTGMVVIDRQGLTSLLAWALVVLGLALLIPFGRHQARQSEPIIDVRLLRVRGQWTVQVAGFLYGLAVVGIEIPNITFLRTDPDVVGYGLGVGAGFVSLCIATQVVGIAIGALGFPTIASLLGTRPTVILGAFLGAVGMALWLVLHDVPSHVLINLAVTGLGAGIVLAALPVMAASAAPADRTGFATGMSATVKNLGGTIASAIFAIVLSSGDAEGAGSRFAPFEGYLTVWSICACAALLGGVVLFLVPRTIDQQHVAPRTV